MQFEAMLTAARESSNTNDFALVAMLGLLGLRIFESTGADITDLGDEHGQEDALALSAVFSARRSQRLATPG